MSRRVHRLFTPVAFTMAVALGAAGCGYKGARSLPLPSAVRGQTYSVTVTLTDATNLVPQETCRANDAIVGSVASVSLDSQLRAVAVCRIKASVRLPANVQASLQQTGLLGERFVALDPPPGRSPRGILAPGARLPVSDTRTNPDVETVLGALSQVLNGGSLGSIQTITHELSSALSGSDLRGTLDELRTTVGVLDEHRGDIDTALSGLDRFSAAIAGQRRQLARALDQIPAGLAALNRQRPRLVAALQELQRLASVARPLIASTKAATVADLQNLEPVLTGLRSASDELALTLERVAAIPFPSNATAAIRGDYAGFNGTLRLDLDELNTLLGSANPAAVPSKNPATTPAGPTAPTGTLSPAPGGLPDLSGIVQGLGAPVNSLLSLLDPLLGGT